MAKSFLRVRKDAGWSGGRYSKEKGPNGRGLCRLCGVEVPKGRRTFCSKDCVHEWRLTSDPGYIRSQLWKRDKGVCSICGTSTVELVKTLEEEFGLGRKALKDRLAEFGIDTNRWYSRRSYMGIWDADHEVPVSEGGGEADTLDSFRTLCLKCHKAETKKLKKRLADKRKRERLIPINKTLFGND